LGVSVAVGAAVGDGEAVAVPVAVDVGVAVAGAVGVGDAVALGVGDAVGSTVGEAVGVGLGLGVVVSRPPCPRKMALAKMRAKTTITAATKSLVQRSSMDWTVSPAGGNRSSAPGRGARASSFSVTRRCLLGSGTGAGRV